MKIYNSQFTIHNLRTKSRFSVIYSITGKEKEALETAKATCIEQTIEFPYGLVTKQFIKEQVVGRIGSFKGSGKKWLAEISYLEETAGGEFTQLLNVIFGNTSIKTGIKVEKIALSTGLLKGFKGPGFGVQGIRKLARAYNRPLLCSALKPMGLSSKELANMAYKFALGGIDVIKDDHGLTNQVFAPFKQRVAAVCAGVKKANKETGGNCLYAPNITADGDIEILKRAKFAKRAGAGALVISPGLAGFNGVRKISGDPSVNLPVLFHPALIGSFTASKDSGFSHYFLYGQLARLCGADVSIFPNYGGRFPFSKEDCAQIVKGCRDKFSRLNPIFPGPGGGMTLESMPKIKEFYGNDAMFLMGGGLFANGPDITSTVRRFRNITGSSR